MNQMPRQQSASRISEDIGDVLSAIRRLIADDEAMDYTRDSVQQPTDHGKGGPERDDGQALAARFGGPAALARRMVQDSAALADRRTDAEKTFAADSRTRSHLVADRQVPTARPMAAEIVALRDPPVRQGTASLTSDRFSDPLPLRLSQSDRVSALVEDDADSDDHELSRDDLSPTPYAPMAEISAGAADEAVEESDGFDEAFDAKARPRTAPAGWDAAMPAGWEGASADPVDDDPFTNTAARQAVEGKHAKPTAADPFWEAYSAQASVHDVDPQPADDTEDAVLPAVSDLVEDAVQMQRVGLSIPAYTDDARSADAGDEVLADGAHPLASADEAPAEDIKGAGPADLADACEVNERVDEASIREVIRELIQEELHGELGQRFSRNLRAVIRREVAASIDEHLERL
ncbi:hypothetical protein [Paracoccus tegillarcae]|uniref:DUF2497 domain-containing protein n=1 Tax=Paracoccus tegillarcae TaxID=1529068 RepID=A0A2K9ELT3_9RHOB|nr:hypothetical protein [Paracoccus tegillarcae]AUH32555.1 hypothetical protein CUV01_03395 [Paracoccus tegillarcae]